MIGLDQSGHGVKRLWKIYFRSGLVICLLALLGIGVCWLRPADNLPKRKASADSTPKRAGYISSGRWRADVCTAVNVLKYLCESEGVGTNGPVAAASTGETSPAVHGAAASLTPTRVDQSS